MTWAMVWPITVTDANKTLKFHENTVDAVTCDIATGVYRDIISDSSVAGSLAKAIKTAMDAASLATANAYTYTITFSDLGFCTVTLVDVDTMYLDSAASGSTFANLIGFNAQSADARAVTAEYQHYHGFYGPDTGPDMTSDTYFWRAEHRAELRRANSGKQARRPFGSTQEFLELAFGLIPSSKIDAATTAYDAYKSLRDLYNYTVGGDHRYHRWYRDTSTPTDTDTYDDVWWDTPELFEYAAERMSTGVERWSAEMKVWKHVA